MAEAKVDWSDPAQVLAYKNQKSREWYERNKEKARGQKREAAAARRAADPEGFREREREYAARKRERRGVQPRVQWRVDDDGRQCTYSGEDSCQHAYRPWSDFSPVKRAGVRGHETRCRACKVAYQRTRLRDSPEARAAHNARQAKYQKTEKGKVRARRSRLRYVYGITVEQYEYLEVLGGGNCWIHGGPPVVRHHASGGVMRLAVEHAHNCDQGHGAEKACKHCVRGLACYDCNRNVIARADQYPALRERFLDYLSRRPLLEPGAPA